MLSFLKHSSINLRNGARSLSSLVNLSINEQTGIAKLEMNNHPVNSLGQKFLGELLVAIDQVKQEKCRGMILASGAKSTFAAGLDLTEVQNADPTAFRKYWYLFQEINFQLYSAPFLTVAAITGHSPAGGCVMSLTTDYRVMTHNPEKPFRIGLNETALGLSAPIWIQSLLTDVIGKRQAAQALLSGTLFTTEEAFKIGLVDEMGSSREDTLSKAELYLNMYRDLPIHALIETKMINRKKFITEFQSGREFDILNFSKNTLSAQTQDAIGKYFDSLKKKK